MPKKSRRGKSKYRARVAAVSQERRLQQPKLEAVQSQTPRKVAYEPKRPIADYRYVWRDAKNIGLLAGSLIVILIVLYYVLG